MIAFTFRSIDPPPVAGHESLPLFWDEPYTERFWYRKSMSFQKSALLSNVESKSEVTLSPPKDIVEGALNPNYRPLKSGS
jgi:hypothetical protein